MSFANLNIEAMKSQLRRGSRSNLFYVQVTAPAVLAALGVDVPEDTFEFFCKGAKLPKNAVGDVDVKYMGHTLPFAGDTAHDHDMTLTIINEEDFKIHDFISKWVQLIKHPVLGTAVTATVYEGRLTITQLDGLGNAIKTKALHHFYFKDNGDIELGWDNENQIEIFSAIGRYAYFTDEATIDFSVAGLAAAIKAL